MQPIDNFTNKIEISDLPTLVENNYLSDAPFNPYSAQTTERCRVICKVEFGHHSKQPGQNTGWVYHIKHTSEFHTINRPSSPAETKLKEKKTNINEECFDSNVPFGNPYHELRIFTRCFTEPEWPHKSNTSLYIFWGWLSVIFW